jgi:phenylacetate-CoA ligase
MMLPRQWLGQAFDFAYHDLVRGDGTHRAWRELERSQWLDEETLRTRQLEKLHRLLGHCRREVPWYTPRVPDLSGPAEAVAALAEVPLLDKETIRANTEALRATDCPARAFRKSSTSGSTGESLFFYLDNRTFALRTANTLRFTRGCGVSPFAPYASLWGARFDEKQDSSLKDRLGSWAKPHLFLSSYDLSEGALADYARRLVRFGARLLVTYPSPLERFAHYCDSVGARFPALQAISSSAEQLHPHQRALFERVFQVPVFDRYGCREFAGVAQECDRHDGLHIAIERVFLEVVREDGSPCDVGEEGELVITDLDNFAMPFVRYRTGDRGALASGSCPCGRGLPRLQQLGGRTFELIRTPSGAVISGTFWTLLTRHVSQRIRHFQVVQTEPARVEVRLVMVDGTHLGQGEVEQLRAEVSRAAPDLEVAFEYVDHIPLTPGGKQRLVIGLPTDGKEAP